MPDAHIRGVPLRSIGGVGVAPVSFSIRPLPWHRQPLALQVSTARRISSLSIDSLEPQVSSTRGPSLCAPGLSECRTGGKRCPARAGGFVLILFKRALSCRTVARAEIWH